MSATVRPEAASLQNPQRKLGKKITELERRIRTLELRPDVSGAGGSGFCPQIVHFEDATITTTLDGPPNPDFGFVTLDPGLYQYAVAAKMGSTEAGSDLLISGSTNAVPLIDYTGPSPDNTALQSDVEYLYAIFYDEWGESALWLDSSQPNLIYVVNTMEVHIIGQAFPVDGECHVDSFTFTIAQIDSPC